MNIYFKYIFFKYIYLNDQYIYIVIVSVIWVESLHPRT